MSFWRQFGQKWDQIQWKSHHFLRKCHGNSMTWTYPKSTSCSSMENKGNLDEWHGMVMEFGVDLDQTTVDLWRCEMAWNFHDNPRHIFYRDCLLFEIRNISKYRKGIPGWWWEMLRLQLLLVWLMIDNNYWW